MAYDLIFGKTKRDWSCGSVVLPKSQEKRIFEKLDDVRYDIRNSSRIAKIGLLSLSAAVGFLGITNILRERKKS